MRQEGGGGCLGGCCCCCCGAERGLWGAVGGWGWWWVGGLSASRALPHSRPRLCPAEPRWAAPGPRQVPFASPPAQSPRRLPAVNSR